MKQRVLIFSTAVLLFCISLLFAAHAIFAQTNSQDTTKSTEGNGEQKNAVIRVGIHPDFIRIVFITGEDYVQKASVSPAGKNTIKVEFPSSLVISFPEKGILRGDLPIEIAKGLKIGVQTNGGMLFVDNLERFNMTRLSSPSRLVIDVYTTRPSQVSPAEKPPVARAQADSVTKISSYVIDAGHGGYDKGVRGSNFTEKDLALSFAKELSNALSKRGKKVTLTRRSDQNLSIKERLKIAQKGPGSMLLSIHLSSKNEFSIFIAVKTENASSEASTLQSANPAVRDVDKSIANALVQQLKSEFNIKVTYEGMPIPLIVDADGPALLIELPNPEKFSYDVKNKERLINAILKGIVYPAKVQ
ncbi:MAG: N-acetylmuramoyl-L-alanine amidase [Dissulfurispiraceae bacterium]